MLTRSQVALCLALSLLSLATTSCGLMDRDDSPLIVNAELRDVTFTQLSLAMYEISMSSGTLWALGQDGTEYEIPVELLGQGAGIGVGVGVAVKFKAIPLDLSGAVDEPRLDDLMATYQGPSVRFTLLGGVTTRNLESRHGIRIRTEFFLTFGMEIGFFMEWLAVDEPAPEPVDPDNPTPQQILRQVIHVDEFGRIVPSSLY